MSLRLIVYILICVSDHFSILKYLDGEVTILICVSAQFYILKYLGGELAYTYTLIIMKFPEYVIFMLRYK
jgi:hypothetical protein